MYKISQSKNGSNLEFPIYHTIRRVQKTATDKVSNFRMIQGWLSFSPTAAKCHHQWNGLFAFYFLSDINLKYRYSQPSRGNYVHFSSKILEAKGWKNKAKLQMLLEIHKVNGVANEKADEAKRSGNHPWNFTSYHGKCDVLLMFGWKFQC